MRRVSLSLLVVVCAAFAAEGGRGARSSIPMIDEIAQYRAQTWRWQRLMGVPRTPTSFTERRARREYRRWIHALWKKRAQRVRRRAANPPHEAAWRCIHRHERDPREGWATNTGNGYYGGLQMDLGFQQRYGRFLLRRKGTADKWKPLEQMWVAERAYRSGRGFGAWPNTASACGLL